jgi:hypothetical protein
MTGSLGRNEGPELVAWPRSRSQGKWCRPLHFVHLENPFAGFYRARAESRHDSVDAWALVVSFVRETEPRSRKLTETGMIPQDYGS